MRDLSTICAEYSQDIDSVRDWHEAKYRVLFGSIFDDVIRMQSRLASKERPITDEELEWTLTTFPLNLIQAAESLNQLRLELEVVKLNNATKKTELSKKYHADVEYSKWTAAMKSEAIAAEMAEYYTLQSAYTSIITRVENQLLYSREFIMGAKKVWDSRRHAEVPVPTVDTSAPEDSLPDYIR